MRLSVLDLSVWIGERRLLDGFCLEADPGEIVAVVGPNGSGKTTALDAVCGLVPARGRVCLDGVDLSSLGAAERARRGISRSFQNGAPAPALKVSDLLAVAPTGGQAVADMLAAVGLTDLEKHVAELSTGQRRLLDVAMALAGAPAVALLDEPVAVLDDRARGVVAQQIRDVAASGTAVVVVEHDRRFTASVADRVVEVRPPEDAR